MKRKQFTFYRSIYESAMDIADPLERLALYEAVIEFALFEKTPQGLSPWISSVFKSIRPNLESSMEKAKMGMKSKRGPAKKEKNNESEKEKENEIEKEKEIENEIEIELEDECLAGGGFTEFWEKYPLKVGKQKARQIWEDSVKDPRAVMEGLEKWKRSAQWNRENGRYVTRAAKFLEDEDWRADPPGYVPAGGTGKLGAAELEAIEQMMRE